jgi:hypothetical protein
MGIVISQTSSQSSHLVSVATLLLGDELALYSQYDDSGFASSYFYLSHA